MGFTYASHYCAGELVESSFGLGQKADGCGMDSLEDSCNSSKKTSISRKGCCENQILSIDFDDNLKEASLDNIVNLNFIISFTSIFFKLELPNGGYEVSFENYSPPPLRNQDVQILFQTFLI